MIGYAVFQNAARSPEVRPLFYLSLSDLFLGGCWLTGALLYSQEATESTNQDAACYNLQTTGQIFYIASFLYTVNYTWHLYTDLKVKYNQNLHSQPLQMLSYTNHMGRIAIILSRCLLMYTELSSPKRPPCSAMYFYSIGVFLVSFASSFLVILVLLIRARALYKRFVNSTGYVGDQQWAMIKMVEQGVVLYPVVFFCCWGPAFILGLVKVTSMSNVTLCMVLRVLEGLLNCAVYGWTQHMFRSMKRKACRDVDTQTPLLRSQKRFYASTLPANSQMGAKASSTSTSTVL
ncbi:hypothetical protein JD844_015230 [Phrynosoma platyrhinos]|uniref:Transmembrane protein 116 n=1 Tax=Phrynosoma platyrhinos TaxID=52577 RepID=A0ABQ7T854_PHRPL|nr:hypothetical protein JD844_015230 [Phrynosoma platyrhinos]